MREIVLTTTELAEVHECSAKVKNLEALSTTQLAVACRVVDVLDTHGPMSVGDLHDRTGCPSGNYTLVLDEASVICQHVNADFGHAFAALYQCRVLRTRGLRASHRVVVVSGRSA